MVRLRGWSRKYFNRRNLLSIPIWWDWEWGRSGVELDFTNFQFQYGEIESAPNNRFCWVATYFQFQYGEIERCLWCCVRVRFFRLSIPIWWDWEYIYRHAWRDRKESFNSNMVRLRVILRLHWKPKKRISIPIWCDWELDNPINDSSYVDFNSYMVRLRGSLLLFW